MLTSLPVVRAIAMLDEIDLLARIRESLRRAAPTDASHLTTSLTAADGLLALARGRTADAVDQLESATGRERLLENTYNVVCLELDLARAYDAAGDAGKAGEARARAAAVLEPLGCVSPY